MTITTVCICQGLDVQILQGIGYGARFRRPAPSGNNSRVSNTAICNGQRDSFNVSVEGYGDSRVDEGDIVSHSIWIVARVVYYLVCSVCSASSCAAYSSNYDSDTCNSTSNGTVSSRYYPTSRVNEAAAKMSVTRSKITKGDLMGKLSENSIGTSDNPCLPVGKDRRIRDG